MLFNIRSKTLYTDDKKLIKVLHCPLNIPGSDLRPAPDSPHLFCDQCEKTVHDTALLSEAQTLQLLKEDPETCLAIRPNQKNITFL